eukprot:GEMP01098929.1.p1 GENE.GEMP01098929.1~~GEMP01098929.1.p1  ORF type:complete len:111 (+),score=7.94 GEMP01098929.1:78-410(+)
MTLVLSLVLTAAATSTPSVKMCFASCARVPNPQESQPWWELIVNQQPAAFTWLGDAVYADKWSLERFTTGNKLLIPIIPHPLTAKPTYEGRRLYLVFTRRYVLYTYIYTT